MARITKVADIDIDRLVIGKSQARTRDVGKDIDGLLEPIVVAPSDRPDKLEIITGHRRFLAHRQLKKKTILAAILDQAVDETTAKVLSLTENLLRRDLNIRDLIDACTALYKTYGSVTAVVEETGLPDAKVRQYIKYERLIPELKVLVDKQEIKLPVALRAQDAAAVTGKIDPKEAVQFAIEMEGMSGAQRTKLVKDREEEPTKPIEEVIEDAKTGEKITQNHRHTWRGGTRKSSGVCQRSGDYAGRRSRFADRRSLGVPRVYGMMLRALTPEEHRDLLVSVGTHRGERRLSPIEVARLLARERAAGTPVRQLAEALGFKGASTIGSFLSLLELDGDVQGLIDWGRGTESTIPFTAAADISRLPRDEQMPAIRMTFENMLSSAEVRDLTQLRTRSGKPLVECLQQVLRRRRQVVRRHLLIGAITSDMTRDYLDRISQLERDRLFRGILESTFPDLPSLAGRLTPSRFFIVGDDTVAKTITMAGNFAEQINGALWELDVGG